MLTQKKQICSGKSNQKKCFRREFWFWNSAIKHELTWVNYYFLRELYLFLKNHLWLRIKHLKLAPVFFPFLILARIYSRVYRHRPLTVEHKDGELQTCDCIPPPPVGLTLKGCLMRIQWECDACCELAGRRLHAVRWWKRKRGGNLHCLQKKIMLW